MPHEWNRVDKRHSFGLVHLYKTDVDGGGFVVAGCVAFVYAAGCGQLGYFRSLAAMLENSVKPRGLLDEGHVMSPNCVPKLEMGNADV